LVLVPRTSVKYSLLGVLGDLFTGLFLAAAVVAIKSLKQRRELEALKVT